MSSQNDHSIPSSLVAFPIPRALLSDVVEEARVKVCLSGCLVRTEERPGSSDLVSPFPFALLPAPIPRDLFRRILEIQPLLNELYFKVANDFDFLRESLEGTVEVDDYIAKQWQILAKADKIGRTKKIQLGLLRSDYMLDVSRGEDLSISQLEVNTVGASMAGNASSMAKIHRFIIGELGEASDSDKVPLNHACSGFAEAIHTAWKLYGNTEAIVLILIHSPDRIIFDQRLLSNELQELEPAMRIVRRTSAYVGKNGSLTEDRRLLVDNEEVAVCYYRTGFTPEQYNSEMDWKAKLLAELSTAAVCPSVGWQLAGTKRVQQELTRPGVLERFIQDPGNVALVRSTFTGLYSLDPGPEGDEAVSRAIANPEKFVLKPQREAGGQNIYGEDMRTLLRKISDERSRFTLMDRIPSRPTTMNYIIRSDQYSGDQPVECINEFGCYGSFVSHNGKIIRNKTDGHLVKTKPHDSDEVKIMSTKSGLNSPFLI